MRRVALFDRPVRIGAVGASMVLLLSGCGAPSDQAGPAPTVESGGAVVAPPVLPGEQIDPVLPAVKSDLPNVRVSEVLSGRQVELTSLAPSQLPTLLWFYAPH